MKHSTKAKVSRIDTSYVSTTLETLFREEGYLLLDGEDYIEVTSVFSINIYSGKQTIYRTNKGIISMVEPCIYNNYSYEICCQEGELFSDTERYADVEEAEVRIKELLLHT